MLGPDKPNFKNVVDFGLRDVGVENDPRGHAAVFGKTAVKLFALILVSTTATCLVAGLTGATWVVVPFVVAWTVGLIAVSLRSARRSPVVVAKVRADGANQATRLAMTPFLLMVSAAALSWDPLLIPPAALAIGMVVLLMRARDRVPQVLRELRPLLAADERVLGDGFGLVPGERRWDAAFRLLVATDRRLLVVGSTRAPEFVVLDVPYARVSRFGIAWKQLGLAGELSLTLAGDAGVAPETHVIRAIAPANLVSVARALELNGVPADDPALVDAAARAWDEARPPRERRERRTSVRPRELRGLFDRAALNTPAFDRGLWLLLAATAFAFYVNPFGIGLGTTRNFYPLLLLVPAVCAVCGYVSATRSSLAYLVPLNLLVAPAFFFADAGGVISVMVTLSALAALGLWIGSRLREARAAGADAPAAPRPARGSLRYTLSGVGLIRLTGMLLAAFMALVATSSAAGIELPTLRLAVDELTGKQLPVDGRSNLTGGAASLTYTRGPDLRELVTDQHGDSPADGARWELRSSFTKGFNVVSLASYAFEPRLDDPEAVADFVAEKDREHERLAGSDVTHTERVVDGRRGYVWEHGSRRGYRYFAAWFPHPVHTVRVECIARRQRDRFERLCDEAMDSLEFR